jgi:hypothetical protein
MLEQRRARLDAPAVGLCKRLVPVSQESQLRFRFGCHDDVIADPPIAVNYSTVVFRILSQFLFHSDKHTRWCNRYGNYRLEALK